MTEALQQALIICGAVTGVGNSLAAVIWVIYKGKIGLELARAGKYPYPDRTFYLFGSRSPSGNESPRD